MKNSGGHILIMYQCQYTFQLIWIMICFLNIVITSTNTEVRNARENFVLWTLNYLAMLSVHSLSAWESMLWKPTHTLSLNHVQVNFTSFFVNEFYQHAACTVVAICWYSFSGLSKKKQFQTIQYIIHVHKKLF